MEVDETRQKRHLVNNSESSETEISANNVSDISQV